jgi:hypothetical protein
MIRSTYEEVDIPDEYIDVEPVFENPKEILKTHDENSGNNENITNTNSVIRENCESSENSENKKKDYYDYYICPFIGFDGKPCCCEWTINTFTGCSRAWMNPITAFARALQCFPRIGETERCAECSCCLCPCGMCGDCCILLTYCSL